MKAIFAMCPDSSCRVLGLNWMRCLWDASTAAIGDVVTGDASGNILSDAIVITGDNASRGSIERICNMPLGLFP